MEVEVRSVPGINTCFVSLPLHLIHALQSTAVGPLPPLLALELRSRSGASWHVAWSGAPSRSPAIEVAQPFAECISLPNGTTAQVKAVANLPKAEVVTIEPSTEDDWEILEINAEHAEEVIWQQVGIVHEGMRFPLWLHGHTVVVFLVTSTSPKKPVVQLVPGIEVVVAPKKRKEKVIASKDSHNQILGREQVTAKALLRIQAESRQHIHWFEFEGLELGVVLTSVAFIHPETSCKLALDDLQLVSVFPRLVANEISQKGKDNNHKAGSSSPDTEENKKLSMTSKESYKQTVVHILRSDSVAKGHIMLPQSLRLFLKVNVHSWVYIKKYNVSPKREMPSMRLSPCRFKLSSRNSSFDDDGMEDSNNNTSLRVNFYGSGADWSLHDEIPALICKKFLECKSEDRTSDYCSAWQKMVLIEIWLSGQLKGIGSQVGVSDILSVVLPKETLFHFEVKNFKSKNEKDVQPSSDFSLNERSNRRESTIELLFLLSATLEAAAPYALPETYELTLDVGKGTGDNMHCWKTELKNLEIGDPISLSSLGENRLQRNHNLTVSSLTWMQSAITDVIDRLIVLLFPSSRRLLSSCRLPLPGHVLVCGPSGSGKTSLAMAVAKYLEEHEVILAHVVYVSCSKYYQERTQTVRQAVAHYVSEALSHSPSVIIFDDLDSIISVSSQAEAAQPSSSATVLTKFLTDMLDEYGNESQSSCGYGPIAFLATVQALGNLPQSLSSSGRFDFHVQLPASAIPERVAMLKHEICKLGLQCSEDVLAEVAPKCDGYDAYDLELLVERAVFNASSRFMDDISDKDRLVPKLMLEDFIQAMHDFVPVAMRRLTKGSSEGDQTGWQNVGGLMDIRNAIQEMVELPSKFPSIFSQAPLRLRSNMLLYGPPGCGKTHIVRAAATAFSLRFISIKGPELLNKYIGASEQAVRELFAKAAAAAPCLLFFDEFESIAPKRGHDNTGVTDRVVNQFLTELDGVEALTGVFVFAATSRPDLLDAALLRPGRLDRLLLCDFPTWQDRLEILTVLSRKLPVAKNANLRTIASMTEGFTGADLQAILSEAQLASIHEVVDNEESHEPKGTPAISDELLRSVASVAKPSVSEAEKHKLNEIYSQFVESKKSVSSQSREAKGKRATLA